MGKIHVFITQPGNNDPEIGASHAGKMVISSFVEYHPFLCFQQPGELDYAELDDFRPSVQPAASAEAAPARPLIRRPVYEGTEYADITQFGVPQPEPTYGNIPKKDVVYSNVQGI